MVTETEYQRILAEAQANIGEFLTKNNIVTDPASGMPEPGHRGPVVTYFIGGFSGTPIAVRYNRSIGEGAATVLRIGNDGEITPADLETLKQNQPQFYAFLEAEGRVAPLPPGYIGRTDGGLLIPEQGPINEASALLTQEIESDYLYFRTLFSSNSRLTIESLSTADKERLERLLGNMGATEITGAPLVVDGRFSDGTNMAIAAIEAEFRTELPSQGIVLGGGVTNTEAKTMFGVYNDDVDHGLGVFTRLAARAIGPTPE